jgi:hypothetical protein
MSAVAATLIVVFGACEDQGPQIPTVAVTLQNLMTLDPATEGSYEGWVIDGAGAAISTGKFVLPADGR